MKYSKIFLGNKSFYKHILEHILEPRRENSDQWEHFHANYATTSDFDSHKLKS